MKQVMKIAVLLALGSLLYPKTVRADGAGTGTWRPFGSLDYYGVGDAQQHMQDATGQLCSQIPGSSCSASVQGAEGARIGVLKNVGGFDLGGSLGYLYGGPDQTTINAGSHGTGTISSNMNTIRLLAEARKTFKLSGPWSARIGAGAGWAMSMENVSSSGSGMFAGGNGPSSTSSTGWMTWEISPSIAYKSYNLGLRYVGFARGGDVPWNTWGAFLGYDF